MNTRLNDTKLSPHFKLREFLLTDKYPQNIPTMQDVVNLTYGINSGFRNEDVNRKVGGVRNSQHLIGQAADIRPKDPAQFQTLVDFFKKWEYTDQLLTASTWLHISWNPFSPPRHYVRIGYYT